VLNEGTTKLQSTEDRLATIDRSGGELELGCSMSRGRRGEAWAQNGIGGGRGVLMGALYRAGRRWWGEETADRAAVVENQSFHFEAVEERERSRSSAI
jgi:hypothetical protein